VDLKREERQLLVDLMELFKGGKEGKGVGDLRPFLPRGGLPTLADDLLPRYGLRKELKDSEPVSRLKTYWRDNEKDELVELAHILPLDNFLKLHPDEDMKRLLEALWRTVRGEFDFNGIETIIQTFERNILPVLKEGHELERKGIDNFGLSGLNFETYEGLVKAKGGFEKLLEIAKSAIGDGGSTSGLLRCIVKTFMNSLDIEGYVRNLESLIGATNSALEELTKVGDNLRKNYWEYPKATKFVGITEEDVKELVSEQTKINGTLTLQKLQSDAKGAKEYLEEINNSLGQLERKLNEIQKSFSQA
jgi:hypothetical protein